MVELSEVKAALWVDCYEDDVMLKSVIDGVNDVVACAVGDISLWEKTQFVSNCSLKWNTIALNIINPTQILEINGHDFREKENGVDYMIMDTWEVVINDLHNYISNDFGKFKILYMAGYAETPKSLISIVATYSDYLCSKEWGKDVASEKLGPRSVQYADSSGWDDWVSAEFKSFRKWLRRFIPICLRIY